MFEHLGRNAAGEVGRRCSSTSWGEFLGTKLLARPERCQSRRNYYYEWCKLIYLLYPGVVGRRGYDDEEEEEDRSG